MKIRKSFSRSRPATLAVLAGGSILSILSGACAKRSFVTSPVPVPPIPQPEELWVFVRPETTAAPASAAVTGPGELRMKSDGNASEVPLPPERLDVRATVSGYVATVDVTQRFRNSSFRPTDAVYSLSLPKSAAVSEFIMVLGGRRIRSVVRDRSEAEDIYRQAKGNGLNASLLEGDASGVFRASIANIQPGSQIEVELVYHQVLGYANGWHDFVVPLPAASARRRPDVALRIDLDAGAALQDVTSATHRIVRKDSGLGRMTVSLDPSAPVSGGDFVLRYRLVSGQMAPLSATARQLLQQPALSPLRTLLAVDATGPAAPETSPSGGK